MHITLDLPPALDASYDREAQRDGVALEAHLTAVLQVAAALLCRDEPSETRDAVRTRLKRYSVDPDRVAEALHEAVHECATNADGGGGCKPPEAVEPHGGQAREKPLGRTKTFGMFAGLLSSTDEFLRHKQEDIELEERRYRS